MKNEKCLLLNFGNEMRCATNTPEFYPLIFTHLPRKKKNYVIRNYIYFLCLLIYIYIYIYIVGANTIIMEIT